MVNLAVQAQSLEEGVAFLKGKALSRDIGEFDYVIVGGGTAGCLLANRLTADPSINVLMLEAGGNDNYHWIHIPVGYLHCINNPRTDWCYKTEPQASLSGRSIGYARGKVMGGCSSINGMVYMRGQSGDYDRWQELGNAGWGWSNVLPYFKKHEDFVHGASLEHGAGGEWRVEEQRLHWPILDVFREACVESGIPKISDFNKGDNFGVSYFQVNQRSGFRVNASKAFINPIRNRSNLKIMTHSHAKEILLKEKTAQGLVFENNGELLSVKAKQEVLLCSGSIGTPQLLELSGIGNKDLLTQLGIKVVQHLPGVGENLQDHLQIRLVFKIKNALTLNKLAGTLWGKFKIAAQYVFTRTGPMSMAPSQLGAFAKSDPSQSSANIQYHIQPLSLDRFGEPLHSFSAITASVCNLRPTSRGSVHITSSDFKAAPSIQPNYLSTPEDIKVLADSVRFTRGILKAKSMAPHEPEEFRPGVQFQTDEEIASAAADLATTIFHPVGTAKMGSDEMAVVSNELKVHGIKKLRIVDASVMPNITSGNTNAPTLMIAERAAEMILNDLRNAN